VIFQDFEVRFFLVFSVQLIIVGIYSILAITLLRRNRNRLTYLLSTFFLLASLTFVLFSYYAYALAVYFITLGFSFLMLFMVNLLNNAISKPILLYVITYSAIALIGALFPGSFQYSASANWIPIWSLGYYIFINLLFAIAIVFPQIILSFKIHNKLKDMILKKNFYKLFLGIFLDFAIIYATAYYNAFIDNEIFRAVWSVLTFFAIPSAGILIYLGIRNNLD